MFSVLDDYKDFDFVGDKVIVINEKKFCGLFDQQTGKKILPCIYKQIKEFDDNSYLVSKHNDKYGLFDKTGKEILPCVYENISRFDDNSYLVYKDYKHGLFDKTGKEILPCVYNYISRFDDDFYEINLAGKYGLFDKTWKEILPCVYEHLCSINDDILIAYSQKEYTIFNLTSKDILLNLDDYFDENNLAICKSETKWLGYLLIDKNGNIISDIAERICRIKNFYLCYRREKSCKIYYKRELVAESNNIEQIGDDFLRVDREYFCMDGTKVTKFCRDIKELNTNVYSIGLGLFKTGLIDSNFNILFPFIRGEIKNFDNEYYLIKKYDLGTGLIDKTYKEILPCIYGSITKFDDNSYLVYKNYKHGLFDKTGKEIFPCICNVIKEFDDTLCLVGIDGEENGEKMYRDGRAFYTIYGLFDKTGKEILPCIYEKIEKFDDILYLVKIKHEKNESKYGLFDKTSKEMLLFDYVDCKPIKKFDDGSYLIEKSYNEYKLIDKTGKELHIYDKIYVIDGYVIGRKGNSSLKNKKSTIPCIEKYGFENIASGEIMLEAVFYSEPELIRPISDNIFHIKVGYQEMLVDKKGNLLKLLENRNVVVNINKEDLQS